MAQFIERILGIPAMAVGAGLMYMGYLESAIINVFIYFLLGLGLFAAGIYLLMEGIPRTGKKEAARTGGEIYIPRTMDKVAEDRTDTSTKKEPEEFCTNCGAPITSAGKFCGSCGAPIEAQSPSE